MPAYDYKCRVCEANFTLSGRITEDVPTSNCPGCSSGNVYRVFSPAVIQFKATGFYSIDSKHEQTYVTEIRGE